MGQSVGPKSHRPVVGPNSVRPWISAAGPYIIRTAHEQVAELIGAHPRDVIFTSCATESNHTAIAAALKANPTKRHIVTSQVEHSSVLNFCKALERSKAPRLIQEGRRGSAAEARCRRVTADDQILIGCRHDQRGNRSSGERRKCQAAARRHVLSPH